MRKRCSIPRGRDVQLLADWVYKNFGISNKREREYDLWNIRKNDCRPDVLSFYGL
jgi:hypothetical protein